MNRREILWASGLSLGFPVDSAAYLMPTPRWPKRINSALNACGVDGVDGELKIWPTSDTLTYELRWTGEPRLTISSRATERARWSMSAGMAGDPAYLNLAPALTALAQTFSNRDIGLWFSRYGVETARQRLALVDDVVCMVFGSEEPKSMRPQIWIDQATFLPRRFLFQTAQQRVGLDLIDWRGPVTRGRFPYLIQVRLNGRPAYTLRTHRLHPALLRGVNP